MLLQQPGGSFSAGRDGSQPRQASISSPALKAVMLMEIRRRLMVRKYRSGKATMAASGRENGWRRIVRGLLRVLAKLEKVIALRR